MVQPVNSRPLISKGTSPLPAEMIYCPCQLSPQPVLWEESQLHEMGLQGPFGSAPSACWVTGSPGLQCHEGFEGREAFLSGALGPWPDCASWASCEWGCVSESLSLTEWWSAHNISEETFTLQSH